MLFKCDLIKLGMSLVTKIDNFVAVVNVIRFLLSYKEGNENYNVNIYK